MDSTNHQSQNLGENQTKPITGNQNHQTVISLFPPREADPWRLEWLVDTEDKVDQELTGWTLSNRIQI